jgi:hypothetical protein
MRPAIIQSLAFKFYDPIFTASSLITVANTLGSFRNVSHSILGYGSGSGISGTAGHFMAYFTVYIAFHS